MELLRTINNAPESTQLLRDLKILSIVEDISCRAFPLWENRVLNFGTTIEMPTNPNDDENYQKLVKVFSLAS